MTHNYYDTLCNKSPNGITNTYLSYFYNCLVHFRFCIKYIYIYIYIYN